MRDHVMNVFLEVSIRLVHKLYGHGIIHICVYCTVYTVIVTYMCMYIPSSAAISNIICSDLFGACKTMEHMLSLPASGTLEPVWICSQRFILHVTTRL